MKVVGKIVQWFFVAFFLMFILVSGVHISSLFFLLGAVLMMPIKPLRDLLKKIKIKSWLAILLSVVVVFTGIMLTPVDTGSHYDYIDDTDYTVSDFDYTEVTTQETTEKQTEKSTEVPTNPPTEPPTEKPTEAIVGSGKAEEVKVSDIPEYSGTAYTVINNNIPNFSASELTTKGYEKYSSLDSKGRCGVAIASCGTEIMPADGEERGSISSIKPSGWIQAKYSGISGGYLWNRCHLIGWQLSAENANRSNLITGTRYMNIEGMLTFENMVADYIKETNNHVAYRVTPIFEDDNLVCSGVQIEAYSNEDYCKWCYADGTYTYSDMNDLIEVCVKNMVSENFTEEQVRSYLKGLLPKLDYWKRYDELSDNGQFEEFKQQLIREINELHIEGLPKVKKLNALVGKYVNLEYMLPNGNLVKFLDDQKTYLGNQLESEFGGERCFGVIANMDFLLVCTYEKDGLNPELVLYKKR